MDEALVYLIKAFAQKEIELCSSQEELRKCHKRWMEYFVGMNKYLMGKGGLPYFGEDGKIYYEGDEA